MLIMPYSHDQPDNARRMQRLKVARVLLRQNFTPLRVVQKLKKLLENPIYARRAQQIALRLKGEDGIQSACDALEELKEEKSNLNRKSNRLSHSTRARFAPRPSD